MSVEIYGPGKSSRHLNPAAEILYSPTSRVTASSTQRLPTAVSSADSVAIVLFPPSLASNFHGWLSVTQLRCPPTINTTRRQRKRRNHPDRSCPCFRSEGIAGSRTCRCAGDSVALPERQQVVASGGSHRC